MLIKGVIFGVILFIVLYSSINKKNIENMNGFFIYVLALVVLLILG